MIEGGGGGFIIQVLVLWNFVGLVSGSGSVGLCCWKYIYRDTVAKKERKIETENRLKFKKNYII